MSYPSESQADDVVLAALRAWRSAETEAQHRDHLRESIRQLAAHINIRLASVPDDTGLFDTLEDIDELATQVLNSSLVKRLHNIASEREQRATLYAQAANVCEKAITALQMEHKKTQE